jgi:hypothetical protein
MDSQRSHEIDFIKTFIVKEKQERYLGLIQHTKSRKKFRLILAHTIEINKKKAQPLKKEEDNEEHIYQLLKNYGAPDICHVMCENSNYDAKETGLREALHELYNMDFGYIISCIPGKLAYYQGEDPLNKAILLDQISNV